MNELFTNLRTNQRLITVLEYALVGAMMACFTVSILQVGRALSPTVGGNILVLLGFLLSLEAFSVFRMRNNYTFMEPGWFIFYLTEWVVILLVVKFFQFAAHDADFILAELQGWQTDFFAAFFNPNYFFTLIMALAVWGVSLMIAQPLNVLRVDERLLRIEEEVGMSEERATARRQLVDIVLFVGVFMVILTSMLRSDASAQWFNLPAMRLGVANVVVYFALGLVLLSLTQFAVLRMRWSVNRVTISPRLASRWGLYSLIFLLLLAGIALILPTGYARNLLVILSWLMQVFFILLFLLYQIMTLPFLLIAALLSLLAGEPPDVQLQPIPPIPPMEATPETPSGFLAVLRTILITVLTLGLVIFSLVYVFRARKGQLSRMPHKPWIGWLLALWTSIADWFLGVSRIVAASVLGGVQKLRSPAPTPKKAAPWRYLRLSRLTARQKVLFYYLALVRRGAETGIPRRPSQTPYEYADSLSSQFEQREGTTEALPAAGEDIQAITDSFIQAQYSRHEISGEQASAVQGIWERLRRILRRKRT